MPVFFLMLGFTVHFAPLRLFPAGAGKIHKKRGGVSRAPLLLNSAYSSALSFSSSFPARITRTFAHSTRRSKMVST